MVELGDYILMALLLSAALGVVGAISHPVLFDESRSAIGVLCLFALASPLVAFIPSLVDLPALLPGGDSSVSVSGGYAEVSEEAFSRGISEYISDEFSLAPELVNARTEGFDFTEMRAERVTVSLSGEAALADARGIRLTVLELFVKEGGECEVVISFEK